MKYILALLVLAAMSMPVAAEELSRKSFKQVASLDRDDFKPFRPKPAPPAPEPEPEPAPTPAPPPPMPYPAPVISYGFPVQHNMTMIPTYHGVAVPVPQQRFWQPMPVLRGGFFRGGSSGAACVGGG